MPCKEESYYILISGSFTLSNLEENIIVACKALSLLLQLGAGYESIDSGHR